MRRLVYDMFKLKLIIFTFAMAKTLEPNKAILSSV